MKITFKSRLTKFECINIGDCFCFNNCIFMRICENQNVNAVNLNDGILAYFKDYEIVECVKVELQVT